MALDAGLGVHAKLERAFLFLLEEVAGPLLALLHKFQDKPGPALVAEMCSLLAKAGSSLPGGFRPYEQKRTLELLLALGLLRAGEVATWPVASGTLAGLRRLFPSANMCSAVPLLIYLCRKGGRRRVTLPEIAAALCFAWRSGGGDALVAPIPQRTNDDEDVD